MTDGVDSTDSAAATHAESPQRFASRPRRSAIALYRWITTGFALVIPMLLLPDRGRSVRRRVAGAPQVRLELSHIERLGRGQRKVRRGAGDLRNARVVDRSR